MAEGLFNTWRILALCLAASMATTNAIYVRKSTGEILYFNTPPLRFGTQVFNITGAKLIVADPLLTFCVDNEQDFTDRIVLMGKDGCSPTTKIQVAKSKGAAAIILGDFGRSKAAGNLYWRTVEGRWPDEDQILPVVTINQIGLDLLELLKNDTDELLLGDLDSNEFNVWQGVLESDEHVVLCSLIIAASVAGLGFALSRLISLLLVKGCALTTGHFALSFICGGFATMAIYYVLFIIDLRVGPAAPEPWYTAFLTFPELFSLLSCLIVSLYWFELINSVSSSPILFLNKLFKPFIGISVAVTVVWIFINIAAGVFLGDVPFLVFSLAYFLISLMVVIIWLIVGIRLLKTVRANQQMTITAKKQSSFNRLAVCIILCAAFFLNTRILFILLTLLPSVGNPDNWMAVAGAIAFSQLAALFIQTGLFKMQKQDFKTSGDDSRGDFGQNANTRTGQRGSTTLELSRTVERGNTTSRVVDSPVASPKNNAGSVGNSSSSSSSSSSSDSSSSSSSESLPKQEGAAEPSEKSEVTAGSKPSNSTSGNEAHNESNQSSSKSLSSSSSSSESSSSSSDRKEDSRSSNERYSKTDSSS